MFTNGCKWIQKAKRNYPSELTPTDSMCMFITGTVHAVFCCAADTHDG